MRQHLERAGDRVLSIHSRNYAGYVGARADVLVNCNGNSFRYRASQDPRWDFEASVLTVHRSLFDFGVSLYVYVSTVDVYNAVGDPNRNHEAAAIQPEALTPYAFHKWMAERTVERYAPQSAILRVGTVLGPGLRKNPVYDLLHGLPLYMSPDSELSFIDAETVARCVASVVGARPQREIYNVAASGAVSLRNVETKLGVQARLAAGAAGSVLRYHINNVKMARLLPLPTSADVVDRFLASVPRATTP